MTHKEPVLLCWPLPDAASSMARGHYQVHGHRAIWMRSTHSHITHLTFQAITANSYVTLLEKLQQLHLNHDAATLRCMRQHSENIWIKLFSHDTPIAQSAIYNTNN